MKRTKTTNSILNVKTKRTKTTNSLKFSVYLPDECWELVLKHLVMNDQDCSSLSVVSKRFLSITNRLRSSLTIKSLSITNRLRSSLTIKSYDPTTQQVLNLIGRFPNLTSLNFCGRLDLDYILPQLHAFPFRLTSLKISNIPMIPASGLVAFSITSSLNSLTCSNTSCLHSAHMFLIGNCFPMLKRLDLSHCKDIYGNTISLLLEGCCDNITHLNLTACSIFREYSWNFQVPTLKVLNLSHTLVDDETLDVISTSCTGILQLSLECCRDITHMGVKHVLRNCTKLRVINLKHCTRVVGVSVAYMVLLRPSLRKITLP